MMRVDYLLSRPHTSNTQQHQSAERKQRGSRNIHRYGMKSWQFGHRGSDRMQNSRGVSRVPAILRERMSF